MARNVYSVKQVNAYIKNMFAQDYMLNCIYVRGEVSNLKYHTSGHIYFSLKDESGTIACVMFAGQRGGLSFRMCEGQQVIALGSVAVYERNGAYQLYAREIRLDGEGDLYERFQLLKKELEEMGMFAPEYKKTIPAFAGRIGVVTASTGAAVRDIMNIAKRRNPFVQILLYPAQVQGEGAKESIVRGIRLLDRADVDVIIVGRGGGSMEDLWAFNEEEVARAIFDCETPVISAVGHETDTTIADLVADLRAPTPSAAAELAVTDYRQLMSGMELFRNQLADRLEQKISRYRQRLQHEKLRLMYVSPQYKLNARKQYLSELSDRFAQEMDRKLTDRKHRLQLCAGRLDGLSPVRKLSQGYSYTELSDKKALRSITQVQEGDPVLIHVTDGKVRARVEALEAD